MKGMRVMLSTVEKLHMTKMEKTVLTIGSFVIAALMATILFTNIYFIANKLGIHLAPGWYQDMVNYVSAGGSLAGAFSVVAGVTLPAWIVPIATAFGAVSA